MVYFLREINTMVGGYTRFLNKAYPTIVCINIAGSKPILLLSYTWIDFFHNQTKVKIL